MSENWEQASKDSFLVFPPQEWGDDDHDKSVISQSHRKLQSQTSWDQLGVTVYGMAGGSSYDFFTGMTITWCGDWAGHSVSLSSDGSVLAVGASFGDGRGYWKGSLNGQVQVFKYINGAWTFL
jgi:hypothetical protein